MEKTCFHCGLDVPESLDLPIHIEDESHPACCAGCQAVAQSIIDAGLGAYYTQRTQDAQKAALPPDDVMAQLRLYDLAEVQSSFVSVKEGDRREALLMLEGITCAACVWLIEQQLLRLPGVINVELNFTTHRARVLWDEGQVKLSDILLRVQSTGYTAHPYDAMRFEEQAKKSRKQALTRLWVAGLSMMQVMMYAVPVYISKTGEIEPSFLWLLHWTSLILTLPVVLYSATPFYQGALRDLKNKRVGMDTPVAIAVLLSFLASFYALITQVEHGIYFDSISMFVFLLLGGRYLEQIARRKAGDATERLIKLVPAFCHRLVDYPHSQAITEGLVAKAVVGDVLLVKAGEVVPVDGIVREGEGQVNEAMLTGESRPVDKAVDSRVTAGTLNLHSPLVIETEKTGDQTRLAGIVRLLDQALGQKPRLAELADRYATWFVALLLLVSVLTFLGWTYYVDAERALWVTVSLLVISCPCALSLATPAALAAATGNLASQGLLVSRSHALETMAQVTDVVFDKTGTLTHGQMSVREVLPLGALSADQAMLIAAALEQQSEHPIARAFVGPEGQRLPLVTQLVNTAGQGLTAMIDGVAWRIGRVNYVAQSAGAVPAALAQWAPEATIVALGNEQGFQAAFALDDVVKDSAAAAVAHLQQQGLRVHVLSGDHVSAVQKLASSMGLDDHTAEATPEDKLAYVTALQSAGKSVLMVGDGINDAPVLAKANVSIAMGSGADVAQEGGDMVLVNNDLALVAQAHKVAKKTRLIIRENLIWAMMYNLVAMPLAIMGVVTPWIAAFGMACSSLLVLGNALRLLRKQQ
ncbi:MAG: heavy metal translocating P-type ATPase [Neisseriaceae bacterium]|nr:heavy metal translocating P-type ATPase [Neisseriaceae bacterium]